MIGCDPAAGVIVSGMGFASPVASLSSCRREDVDRSWQVNTELVFRIALTVIGTIYFGIRLYYTCEALQRDSKFFRPRGDIRQLVFGTLGVLNIVPMVIVVLAPEQLSWAVVPLATGWRWFGVGLGLVVTFLLLWVHHTIGRNFSVPGVMKERQQLITTGPYRWARHPMYTILLLVAIVYFLISANWFIGVIWLGWIVGTVASMIGDEEAALIQRFGDGYEAYMRTGRFLPRMFQQADKD
jgi:protein-S-isoprenylcysteine O-methyltransferase Ste14